MDNITHSLIGIAAAEALFQRSPSAKRPSVAPVLRTAYWLVSLVGNNLPDLDMLYAGFQLNGRLGYLLHHRGHTHTLFFALVQGLILGWAARWFLQRKMKKIPAWDTRALWILAFAAPCLHLWMDGFNNYGVHPFWPAWNGWLYGDSLFIIEPLLWMALIPVLYFATKRRLFRGMMEAGVAALWAAAWILPLVRWYSAILIPLVGVVLWWATRDAKPRVRADICVGTALGIMLLFTASSAIALSRVRVQNQALYPQAKLQDVILTPFPANPLCWSVITVEEFPEARYRMRRGRYSPFIDAAACPRVPSSGTTAFLTPVEDGWGPHFLWEGQYQSAISDLKDYVPLSCSWSGFLRFARAPFLQEEEGKLWAGDLRFDYGPDLGFAELEVPESDAPCPGWIPPWIPPRNPLF